MRNSKNIDGFVPGMLIDMMDIKVLICYLLHSLGEPIDKDEMIDMIFENQIAEYFDLRAAVMELVESGNITEDEEGALTLTEIGRESAEQLESTLPFSARQKVLKGGIKITTLSKRRKATKADIEQTKNGIFLHCVLSDGSEDILSFKLLVADMMQAKMIQEKFMNDPASVYKAFVSSILD